MIAPRFSRRAVAHARASASVRCAAVIGAVLIAINGMAACSRAAPEAERTTALPAVSVRTAAVSHATVPVTIVATGTVAPRPGSFATLSAPAATRITRVYVAAGDRVRAGQPLVDFDRAPFAATFRQAQVARQTAQQAYDRANGLATQGIVPQRDVETARAALAQAEAALVPARRALDFATLRAPFAGVVARITAVRDASADPTQALVQVIDPAAQELRILLTPDDAARVHAGAPLSVTSGTTAGGEALGTGTVIALAAGVDSVNGGVEARARLTRPTRPLRLGEVVRVAVEAGRHANALVVPAAALVPSTSGDGYQVFVVGRGDTVHVRPVTVGVRTEQIAEIVEGVAAGDVVVSEGAYGVEDGVRVTVQAGASAGPPAASAARPAAAGGRP